MDKSETNFDLKQQKKKKKAELIELKLLICRRKLESKLEELSTAKQDIMNKIEEVFKLQAYNCGSAITEIDHILSKLKDYIDQMSNELDSILNSYKAYKLKGILNSDISTQPIDLYAIRKRIKLSLEPNEAEHIAQSKYSELQETIEQLKSRCQQLEETVKFKDEIISGYTKEINDSHSARIEREYFRDIISLISEKLKFHMILSGFNIQGYGNVIEAFCRYLSEIHFNRLSFEFKAKDLELERKRKKKHDIAVSPVALVCEICKFVISDTNYGKFRGKELCIWCLNDSMTGVLEINFPLTCPNNHTLIRYEHRIAKANRLFLWETNIICDRCYQEDEYKKIWHCHECDYDLCLRCYERYYIKTQD